ncbi:UDP-N-acetylglucosamine 2-epimerase (non-hydrolyzing) [Candidatus Acetothermia bacterium]|nr:UDP-N-acetylglucosamine 2-epimerase (non-hydrolyzing) [Candidatus Acetothermia bacterium]MCI2427222.1 UDP-N-acetylglucosamine 2-epimerase (non-hydrolyzing) [Candidatus Acetothermia bacterium]MCI2428658.1 UDP-N-acetylglucosamine 2-epimerase (non-hydrolyzing) [Candidatus Acetothermia bacterium]
MRVLCVFGTRPEAIKLAPVIQQLEKHSDCFESRVCVTAQHREMLDQVLEVFKIRPDVDLDLMRHNQTLPEFTARAVTAISEVLEREEPNWVLIQGDTTTVMCTALAAFYQQIPVGHVEAGLRTHDRYSPFPEEINRHLTSVLATYHFAPTQRAQHALVAEGIDPGKIFVTGNTIVDAIRRILDSPPSEYARRLFVDLNLSEPISIGGESISKKVVLVTAHRRESFGEPFESLCRGIRAIADRNQNVVVIYPVHLNPKVRDPVNRILSGHPRVHLIDPVSYEPFVRLMEQSYIILTDSGGIQEEASVLGKPVLILRDTTERPEIVEAGIGKLVGADEHKILIEAELLLHNENVYRAMSKNADLFGDGHAAERIVATLMAIL